MTRHTPDNLPWPALFYIKVWSRPETTTYNTPPTRRLNIEFREINGSSFLEKKNIFLVNFNINGEN